MNFHKKISILCLICLQIKHVLKSFVFNVLLPLIFMSFLFINLKCFALKPYDSRYPNLHDWQYEGEFGPSVWGRLRREYSMCLLGNEQSPIDITDDMVEKSEKLSDVKLFYNPTPLDLINNGHYIVLNYQSGSKIYFNHHDYFLQKINFHAPSEHQLNGIASKLEIQFVHEDENGNLLIIAILANKGKMNFALNEILNHLPLRANERVFLENISINPIDFKFDIRNYNTYKGSLTTPPCTENVIWIILNKPIEMSLQQIMKFTKVYRSINRPIQSLRGRKILRKQ